MVRLSINDQHLFDQVKACINARRSFEIVAKADYKHKAALARALFSIKNPTKDRVRFLDTIRVGNVLGLIGLVNESPDFSWSFEAGEPELKISCILVR